MKIKPLLPAFSWAAIIFILCAIPGKDLPDWNWVDLLSFDKLIHAFIFSVLVFLIIKGMFVQRAKKFKLHRTIATALAFSIPYGGLLELMQEYFYTDRQGSWPDFVANTVGAITGIWLFKKYSTHRWVSLLFK